jgi:hypothetical protein
MNIPTTIHWRPISEQPEPDVLISAVLASEDDGIVALEYTVYDWRATGWYDEIDDNINTTAKWWVPEAELIAALAATILGWQS